MLEQDPAVLSVVDVKTIVEGPGFVRFVLCAASDHGSGKETFMDFTKLYFALEIIISFPGLEVHS